MADELEPSEPAEPTEEPQSELEAPQNDVASVAPETVSEAITEQADPIKLTGKVWEVVVIQEGWSLNRRYYPREVLEQSIPLWEGEDVCVYGYDPHKDRNHVGPALQQAFPHGTYANKIGHLRNVRGVESNGRYRLVAEFVCTREDVRKELLETYEATGKMPGFSIHADGDLEDGIREGQRGRIVTAITATKELTLVSKPAAGGRAYRIAAGQQNTEEGVMLKELRQHVASRLPKAMAGVVESMEPSQVIEAAAEQLKEMDSAMVELALEFLKNDKTEEAAMVLGRILGGSKEPADDASHEMPEQMGEQHQAANAVAEGRAQKNVRRGDDLEHKIAVMECREVLKESLLESDLPDLAKQQLRAQFGGQVFTESELTKAIKDKRELLSIGAGGKAEMEPVTESIKRHPQVQVLAESADKFQACMDLFMNFDWRNANNLTESEKDLYRTLEGTPQTRSIKRLYQEGSGDWEMQKIGSRGSLTEAVNNTTFSNSLGKSITLVLQHDFANMPQADWQGFVREVDGATLLQRDRVIQGGIGMLPTVAEGGTYQDLGQPAEYASNYSLEKRGGYIEITEEAILNDRIDFIRSIPNKLRNAALEAEKALVYKALIGNLGGSGINSDTSYDSVAHYAAAHDNYSTTALSNAGLVNAKLLTKRQMVFATETALNDATDINSSDASVVVDDATGIRAGMYIRMGSEWMEVTDVSSNTLTVVRGARGSTAASHSDNDPVFSYSGMLPWESNGGFSMFVIVPTELEDEAYVALASQFLPGGGNNDVNTLKRDFDAGRIQVVSVDSIYLGGDVNNWYTAVPWQVAPGLEFGYLSGSRVPQLINQTQDQVGQVFLADTMRFKVKHRIGANNMFHEGRTGHIVSGG